METLGGEKEDGGGLDLGFSFSFEGHHHHHRQKMIRTALPNPAAVAAVCSAGSLSPFSRSSSASSASNKISGNGSCGGGPTRFYDTICDMNDGSWGMLPFAAAFKFQGMAGLRHPSPFTSAQWQELQRQALIFKYFMASAPVPQELVFGSRDFQNAPTLTSQLDRGAGYFNMRFSTGSDPEPGRCRRTDGKKWRCSRDVAHDQKYCERHMHRGRPRSRKPVELRKASAVATQKITTSALAETGTATAATLSNLSPKPRSQSPDGLLPKPGLKLPIQSINTDKEPRYLEWMKADTQKMVVSQQWQLMHSRMGPSTAPPVLQHYDAQPQLNCAGLTDPCCSLLNTDLSALEDDSVSKHNEPPRSFIDAWSNENLLTNNYNSNRDIPSVSSGGRLPPSTLTLSMDGSRGEDADQIEMGLSLSDSAKSQPLSWMTPVSTLGGPLAEVLQSRNIATSPSHGYSGCSKNSFALNLMGCGSNGESPHDSPTGLASSPTGVLQRTLVSHSDSSRSSSPTFGVGSRSEVAVQWIDQTKSR